MLLFSHRRINTHTLTHPHTPSAHGAMAAGAPVVAVIMANSNTGMQRSQPWLRIKRRQAYGHTATTTGLAAVTTLVKEFSDRVHIRAVVRSQANAAELEGLPVEVRPCRLPACACIGRVANERGLPDRQGRYGPAPHAWARPARRQRSVFCHAHFPRSASFHADARKKP